LLPYKEGYAVRDAEDDVRLLSGKTVKVLVLLTAVLKPLPVIQSRDARSVGFSDSKTKQVRSKALHRQRRLIFNDDSYELSYEGADTVEGFLAPRLASLVDTQVDTICWSVLANYGDAPSFDSRVQPVFGEAHGTCPPASNRYCENLQRLVEAGLCPLQIVIHFAHTHGMEAFASVRMNDVHDSFVPGLQTTWKRQHPELLVSSTGVLPDFELYVTAQDFRHWAVRQRKLEIIQEISDRYDIDGFELDYIRHPVLFGRSLRGLAVTGGEVEIITSLMRRIRRITEEAALRRGRPILIAARVPDSFDLARDVGLDLLTWLEEDLIDIVIAGGGYAPFSMPLAELARKAHECGALVYPCVNLGTTQRVARGAFLECVRALASNWYQAGADGIYLWNLATPFSGKSGLELRSLRKNYYACLDEIGDPQNLLAKNKLFCVDNGALEVFPYYAHISSRPPLPLKSKSALIRRGVIQRLPLMVGDDLEAASRSGRLGGLKLMIDLKGAVQPEDVSLRVNGEVLKDGRFAEVNADHSRYRLEFDLSVPLLRQGRNFLEISLSGDRPNLLVFQAMRLKVEYRRSGASPKYPAIKVPPDP
jgi:hypothetical protein